MTAAADGAPLFIVGSARSGTTLLYHTLLSTGWYAVYRGEPAVFDLVAARYGDLRHPAARRRLAREWPSSHLAAACRFGDERAYQSLIESSTGTGDFLRRVMTTIARGQDVARWAVWGPDNLLLMRWIKRELPDARFVHMVRDGRDVALSLATEGWIRPMPWDRRHALLVSALHWEWKLDRGRRESMGLGHDYLELRFEDLVQQRERTLEQLAAFLGHPIDDAAVERDAVGTLRAPNSTFRREGSSPVARWRSKLSATARRALEGVIGESLAAWGYEPLEPDPIPPPRHLRPFYRRFFDLKHAARTHTPLGRLVDPGRLRLQRTMVASDPEASAAGPMSGRP